MLIFNEKKEAERILNDINSTECKISQVLNLIVRYYINEKHYSISDTIKYVNEFAKSCYGGYNEYEWNSYINKIAFAAKKKTVKNIRFCSYYSKRN